MSALLRLTCILAFVSLAALTGCANLAPTGDGWSEAMAERLQEAVGKKQPEIPPQWEWISGVPLNARRAEVIEPTIAPQAVAGCLPDTAQASVKAAILASGQPLAWQEVAGQKIRHFGQLYAAINSVALQKTPVKISLAANSAEPLNVEVEQPALLALYQATAAEETPVVVADEGNTWLLIRRSGTLLKILCRVERQRGLLHVISAIKICSGQPRLLPRDITARCEDVPLLCLNASQCLQLLYGDKNVTSAQLKEASISFGEVSEREDYLLPTNFKSLDARVRQVSKDSLVPPLPALASLEGGAVSYPGSPVLGDARALSGFLARRAICHADEPERTNWILFHHPSLKKAKKVDIEIDLGEGNVPIALNLPTNG